MNPGFGIDIEKATLENEYYRRVLYTTPQQQLVLMAIPVGQDIPLEVHSDTTQFIRFESGTGKVKVANVIYDVQDGSSVTIPPGSYHQVVNTSSTKKLKLYSIYSPPEHPPNLIQKVKSEN